MERKRKGYSRVKNGDKNYPETGNNSSLLFGVQSLFSVFVSTAILMASPNRQDHGKGGQKGSEHGKPTLQHYYTQRHSDALPPTIHTYIQRQVSCNAASNIPEGGLCSALASVGTFLCWLKATCARLFLPDGYPDSVAAGYLPYLVFTNCAAFFSQVELAITDYAFLKGIGFGNRVSSMHSKCALLFINLNPPIYYSQPLCSVQSI